ncbi:MAG: cyclase family protein [Alphaproteobacteria bacterium]
MKSWACGVPGVLLAAALLAVTPAAAQEKAGDGWYPSAYGAEDTQGAVGTLGPEDAKRAAALVKTGKVYQLGGVTGRDTPAYGHRSYNLILYPHAGDGTGAPMGANKATAHDDYLATWLGIGTQIDGFGHFGIDHRYYNGKKAQEIFSPHGAKIFGAENIPPVVTRGVLLNMAAHFGKDRLEAGTVFNTKEIEEAAKAQGVDIRKGDVVLFHTGWQELAEHDPKKFLGGEPGLGLGGARYLVEKGAVAVGADTWGLEVLPNPDETVAFPVHGFLLAKSGVHILENIQTAELAADGAHEFMFVLGVPRFEGAVQMVINPVAIR